MNPPEIVPSDGQENDQTSASSNAFGTAGAPEATGTKSSASSSMTIAEVMRSAIRKLIFPKVLEIAGPLESFVDKVELRKAVDSLSDKYSQKYIQSSSKYIRGCVSSMKIHPQEVMQQLMENKGLADKPNSRRPKTPKKSDGNVRKGARRGK